jgi:hypothetical protein
VTTSNTNLLVVDEESGGKGADNPGEQLIDKCGLDVDEDALSDEHGREVEGHLGLCQLVLHLGQVAKVRTHYVVIAGVQVCCAQPNLPVWTGKS